MKKNTHLLRILLSVLLAAIALFGIASSAQALNNFLKTWQDIYPHSSSDNSDCSLCHGTSTSNLNAYGKDLCLAFGGSVPADIIPALLAIEGLDSDLDGNSNLVEIDANSQPGWTLGVNNQIYDADVSNCAPIGAPISSPSSVPLPLDPPVAGYPVAVPGGPYTGNVNVPINFDGSGSYDSDGGNLVSYEWDFGDGSTGSGMTIQHTYTVAGTYPVSLTVVDAEGLSNTNSTIATISGAAVLDLDIAALKVTSSVRLNKSVTIQLQVNNPGPILGQAQATVVGKMNGVEVYSWSLNVYDTPGGKVTSFNFPSYKAITAGTVSWTATIADVDPDVDLATATTVVK